MLSGSIATGEKDLADATTIRKKEAPDVAATKTEEEAEGKNAEAPEKCLQTMNASSTPRFSMRTHSGTRRAILHAKEGDFAVIRRVLVHIHFLVFRLSKNNKISEPCRPELPF